MFKEGKVTPANCTEALQREILDLRSKELNTPLKKAEAAHDFPCVEKLFKIIEQDTFTAVVSRELQEKLQRSERVDWREIQAHSVQIYSNKKDWLKLREVEGMPDVCLWELAYNDFLGYMAGLLPLLKANTESCGFII